MDRKIEFLYQSITDTQATIRAVDVKIGFLFMVAFLPFTLVKDSVDIVLSLWQSNYFTRMLIFIAIMAWLASTVNLFLTLMLISNPEPAIHGVKPSGLFFGGGLFSTKYSYLWLRTRTHSLYTVSEVVEQLPDNELLISELVYEKMKLTYVRDVKFFRCRMSAGFMCVWLFLSVAMFLYYQACWLG